MHFIEKEEEVPNCLVSLANNLARRMVQRRERGDADETGKKCWGKLKKECKDLIKQQILREQQYLCAYCEKKIENETDAHIEHLKPKSRYLEKCFDYNNLIISCNGNQCSDVNREDYEDNIHSCGYPKDNYFDEEKFLNPVELTDVSDYYSYDIDEGCIKASEKGPLKANYMINLLNLDNPCLNNGRKNAKNALLKVVRSHSKDKQGAIKIFKQLLNSNSPPAFISYLRYYFCHLFNPDDSNS